MAFTQVTAPQLVPKEITTAAKNTVEKIKEDGNEYGFTLPETPRITQMPGGNAYKITFDLTESPAKTLEARGYLNSVVKAQLKNLTEDYKVSSTTATYNSDNQLTGFSVEVKKSK